MRRKRTIASIASVVALLAIVLVVSLWCRQPLPRIPLQDGGEFRVMQITYTRHPSDSSEHNLDTPRVHWWIYRHLPSIVRQHIAPPENGIGYTASDHPALSIWWAYVDPKTHQAEIDGSGDVLMTLDSGETINLGWASPADSHEPDGPGYRQIFVTPVPTHSRHLMFDVPTWSETAHFTIENPAYAP